MDNNIIEALRKETIDGIFKMSSVRKAWPTWIKKIKQYSDPALPTSPDLVVELGKHLAEIFSGTSSETRDQAELSGGGAAWEGLVCWYLNLCLLGTNCVIIKQKKELIPSPIKDALTVMYGNVPSNTESDLIAITFPKQLLNEPEKGSLRNYKKFIDEYCKWKFGEFEVCVIQCKTNWNDNAQVPMLWDIIYSTAGMQTRATVGINNHSVKTLKKFTYAFVTVPSNKRAPYKPDSTAVLRVKALSGGNYWGRETMRNVALSIPDMLNKNFTTALEVCAGGWHSYQLENYKKIPDYLFPNI